MTVELSVFKNTLDIVLEHSIGKGQESSIFLGNQGLAIFDKILTITLGCLEYIDQQNGNFMEFTNFIAN